MQILVYAILFVIFTPRLYFSFMKRGGNVNLKETIAHAAVFAFAVVVAQYFSKRYGILESFISIKNNKDTKDKVDNPTKGLTGALKKVAVAKLKEDAKATKVTKL